MGSKQTTSRSKDARSVIQLLLSQADVIEERVEALIAKKKGKKVSAIKSLVVSLAQLLEEDADALDGAQGELDAEKLDDAEPRERRDELTQKLQQKLSRVRVRCEAAAGGAAARRVGFVGTIPREPAQLLSYAATVVSQAKKHAVEVKSSEMSFSLSKALDGVSALLASLGESLNDVAREGREEQAARAKRNTARDEFDEHYDAIALIAEGLFKLVGLHEQADRVRAAAAVSHQAREEGEGEDEGEEGGGEGEEKSEKPAK